MSRLCTVCVLPRRAREEVDRALAAGEPVRRLASRYVTPSGTRLGRMSVQRHKDEHLPRALLKAQAEEDVRAALDVVTQLKAANSACWQVLQRAREQKNDALVLAAVDRVQRHIELVVRLREAADAAALGQRLGEVEQQLAQAGAYTTGLRRLGRGGL